MLDISRSDGDGAKAGLAISDEVTVAHDKAGAEAADAGVLAPRQTRTVAQKKFHRVTPC